MGINDEKKAFNARLDQALFFLLDPKAMGQVASLGICQIPVISPLKKLTQRRELFCLH